jgi:hypothetical protein
LAAQEAAQEHLERTVLLVIMELVDPEDLEDQEDQEDRLLPVTQI